MIFFFFHFFLKKATEFSTESKKIFVQTEATTEFLICNTKPAPFQNSKTETK